MAWAGAAMQLGGIMGEQYGAYQQMNESQKQAKNLINDSERQAKKMKAENETFSADQESMFLNSGVVLEGSPLLVLEETRNKGLQERGELRERARSEAANLIKRGRQGFLGSLAFGGKSGQAPAAMQSVSNAAGGAGAGAGAG